MKQPVSLAGRVYAKLTAKPPSPMMAPSPLIFKDLVLVGGGHSPTRTRSRCLA